MLGLGATKDGDVAVIVGSSTCHLAQSREGVFGSGAGGCYPDATVEGLYTLEAGQTATGSILDWYRRHFAGAQRQEAERRGVHVFEVLDEQAAAVPPGSEGLVVRDDWQGNRSPYKNPQARGAIVGLSLAHGPGHVFRAIYEATACGTRHILEDAAAHGLRVERDLRRRRRREVAALAPDPRRHPQEARPPRPRERGLRAGLGDGGGRRGRLSTPTSTRPPARWSPSSGSSSRTRPMPPSTTSSSGNTSTSIPGSTPRHRRSPSLGGPEGTPRRDHS